MSVQICEIIDGRHRINTEKLWPIKKYLKLIMRRTYSRMKIIVNDTNSLATNTWIWRNQYTILYQDTIQVCQIINSKFSQLSTKNRNNREKLILPHCAVKIIRIETESRSWNTVYVMKYSGVFQIFSFIDTDFIEFFIENNDQDIIEQPALNFKIH